MTDEHCQITVTVSHYGASAPSAIICHLLPLAREVAWRHYMRHKKWPAQLSCRVLFQVNLKLSREDPFSIFRTERWEYAEIIEYGGGRLNASERMGRGGSVCAQWEAIRTGTFIQNANERAILVCLHCALRLSDGVQFEERYLMRGPREYVHSPSGLRYACVGRRTVPDTGCFSTDEYVGIPVVNRPERTVYAARVQGRLL